MRTETLAIVFTDIKGYTAATSNQTHQENAHMLRRIERVVRPVVTGHNGRVVKTIGDAYMIVFRSPTEAVRCASAVQDRLHLHNTNSSADDAIHLRIAMNLGEVRVHRGDVFGEPVNIAARLEGITPADEIYISESIFLTMNRSDIPTELVGDYELKGIPEPVSVYRVRKFAHLQEDASPEPEEEGAEGQPRPTAAGLPFGGTQLAQWKRTRWLRRAYNALWALAVFGVLGAAFLRYQPSTDFGHLVTEAREAAEKNQPMGILAATGQIPSTATAEREGVRRYRHQAVALLLESGDLEAARAELESLLNEEGRDSEALVLRARLLAAEGSLKEAIADLQAAIRVNEVLAKRPEVIEILAAGYTQDNTRRVVDPLFQQVVGEAGIAALVKLLSDSKLTGRKDRYTVAHRLEKLGAADQVDWVALAIEDLKSTSCKIRKAAISKLLSQADDRAVGPLMKVAEAKGCGSQYAKSTANAIIK